MKELLEAGVHFGHQTRRWNPKMKEYIFGERNGIHIIDLQKTLKLFREASRFVGELSSNGKTVLFIGTKRQAQESVAEEANRCGMFYVNHRWLGGTLTNWSTLQKSIKRLKTLKAMTEDGRMALLSKKEAARLDREMKHLKQNLSGVENMTALPDAMFVIDSHAEAIAVREARRMGVPVVSIVDTNCDPDQVDWVIPGNDDALRAIKLFTSKISDAVIEGRQAYERSQIADQKAAADALEAGDKVEYVDTSAYESYEKQEGDFVEPTAEPAAESLAEPAAEPEPESNSSVKDAAEPV
ncbi:MAG TPA: 30S ribosomal protein S2 [Candidatus Dormibacteraeota bacterium]|nr:30S ribosomal protein S2 [Candidatus Dormibacteraeota bacterium]